jgi:fructosamine-3-kinase
VTAPASNTPVTVVNGEPVTVVDGGRLWQGTVWILVDGGTRFFFKQDALYFGHEFSAETEGVLWIRGHHDETTPEGRALLATRMLVRG